MVAVVRGCWRWREGDGAELQSFAGPEGGRASFYGRMAQRLSWSKRCVIRCRMMDEVLLRCGAVVGQGPGFGRVQLVKQARK